VSSNSSDVTSPAGTGLSVRLRPPRPEPSASSTTPPSPRTPGEVGQPLG
jgi:hypothetical protein